MFNGTLIFQFDDYGISIGAYLFLQIYIVFQSLVTLLDWLSECMMCGFLYQQIHRMQNSLFCCCPPSPTPPHPTLIWWSIKCMIKTNKFKAPQSPKETQLAQALQLPEEAGHCSFPFYPRGSGWGVGSTIIRLFKSRSVLQYAWCLNPTEKKYFVEISQISIQFFRFLSAILPLDTISFSP